MTQKNNKYKENIAKLSRRFNMINLSSSSYAHIPRREDFADFSADFKSE